MTRYKDSVLSAKQEDFNRIKFGNIQVTKINDCIVGQSIFKKLGKKKCTNKKNNRNINDTSKILSKNFH